MVRVLAGDDVVLGVGHQPEHDAGRVADAGDVGDRTVGVAPGVAQRDLPVGGEGVGVGMDVATLAMGDRAVDSVVEPGRPHARGSRLRVELDPAAVEAAVVVVPERAGQQAGSGEHLEAVADPDHWSAAGDERPQALAEPPPPTVRSRPASARRRARRRS